MIGIFKRNKIESDEFKNYLLIKPFLDQNYQQINIARLSHLDSLHLDLENKSVIEFGAGIGDHTLYYLFKNCTVCPTDGRKDLVDYMKRRLGIKAEKIDIEKEIPKIMKIRDFDVVHCYGILYHLKNPLEFIQALSCIGGMVLLETCVSPGNEDEVYYVDEMSENPTQAMRNTGSRPTRKWVYNRLREYFPYVYLPKTQPKHYQFPLNWNNLKKENVKHLIRSIFIASHKPIHSSLLTQKLIKLYR